MSKQRYLLILLLLLLSGLKAQTHLKTEFLGVVSEAKPIWLNRTQVETRQNLGGNFSFDLNSRWDAADHLLGDFPQQKWLTALAEFTYQQPQLLKVCASYRNTLFGSPNSLGLYPNWNSLFEYQRQMEHQSTLLIEDDLPRLDAEAYAIHRNLRVKPIEYIYDFGTDQFIATPLPEQGLDNVYSGISAAYEVLPYLSLGAFTDIKRANFDTDDFYSLNSAGAQADLNYKLSRILRISGSVRWTNRYNENLPPQATNLAQSSIRLQHNLLSNLNGYLSFTNNSCSDARLDTLYLISNLFRAHLQYTFSYDPAQDSYLLAGVKLSTQNDADAYFAEAKSVLLPRWYASAGVRITPDAYNRYSGQLSWNFDPFSDVFFTYRLDDNKNGSPRLHYLGVGSNIYF